MTKLGKLNIAPLVAFVEGASLPRIFCFVIGVPFVVWIFIFYCLQGQGSSHAVTDEVELDISIGGVAAGTLVLGLFGLQVPDTVRNFRVLSGPGHLGHGYGGSTFHRAVKGFLLQGGDLKSQGGEAGAGRFSIYGESFPDENFGIKHTGPYLVGMANTGPDTNGCQFYIATCAASWLDGRHVIFGKVVRNTELVHQMEEVEVDPADRPLEEIKIIATRVEKLKEPYYLSTDPYNLWDYLRGMAIPMVFTFALVCVFGRMTDTIGRGADAEDSFNKLKSRSLARLQRKRFGRWRTVDHSSGEGHSHPCRRRTGGSIREEEEKGEGEGDPVKSKPSLELEDSEEIQQNSTEEEQEEEEEILISLEKKTSLSDDVLEDIRKRKVCSGVVKNCCSHN